MVNVRVEHLEKEVYLRAEAVTVDALLEFLCGMKDFGPGNLCNDAGTWLTRGLQLPVPASPEDTITLHFAPATGAAGGAGNVEGGPMFAQLCQKMAEMAEESKAIKQLLLHRIGADDDESIAPSGVSSNRWRILVDKIQQVVKLDLMVLPQPLHSCCLGNVPPVLVTSIMTWSGNEDDEENIKKMVKHLNKVLCPEGTTVWPVQMKGFLQATLDCKAKGKLHFVDAKTDYLVLTKQAAAELDALMTRYGSVRPDQVAQMLNHIIGFYEAKTTFAMQSGRPRHVRQAVLELLAGDAMRQFPSPPDLVVILGDGNKHYGVHFSDDRSEVHVLYPPHLLPTIPEGNAIPLVSADPVDQAAAAVAFEPTAAAPPSPADDGGLAAARKLLAQALERRQRATAGAGPTTSSGMPHAAPGSGSGMDKDRPGSPAAGGDDNRGSHAGVSSPTLPMKRKAPGGTSGAAAGGQASSRNAEVGRSSAQEEDCCTPSGSDEEADEDRRQALCEGLCTRAALQLLQQPDFGEALGITEAPTSLPLLTRDAWISRMRLMVPDGNGGWR